MKKLIYLFLLIANASLFSQYANPSVFTSNLETLENFLLDADYIPTYYRLELNLNPYQDSFSGKTTVRFTTTSSLEVFKINAQPNLTIESVEYHSSPISTFSRDGNILSIPLSTSLPENQIDSITISYSGNASSAPGLNLAHHAGIPIIETLAEPWHGSSWWVCKDDLQEKVEKIEIFITHPTEFKAASNGLLKSVNSA